MTISEQEKKDVPKDLLAKVKAKVVENRLEEERVLLELVTDAVHDALNCRREIMLDALARHILGDLADKLEDEAVNTTDFDISTSLDDMSQELRLNEKKVEEKVVCHAMAALSDRIAITDEHRNKGE